jgi:hypothetical protein
MGGLLFIVFFLNVTTDQFEKALTFLPPAVMNRQFIRLSRTGAGATLHLFAHSPPLFCHMSQKKEVP